MSNAQLPSRDPGPEPDTSDAAEPENPDERLDAEDAPVMIDENGTIDAER